MLHEVVSKVNTAYEWLRPLFAPEPPYVRLRKKELSKVESEMGRMIIGSNFVSIPRFDREYYAHIKDRPEYFDIYKRWVLAQGPLPPIPEDADFYILRGAAVEATDGGSLEIKDRLLLTLALDMLAPFMDHSMTLALNYLDLRKEAQEDEGRFLRAAHYAATYALAYCDKEHVEREGYDCAVIAFMDVFRGIFSKEIKPEVPPLPESNDKFAEVFEKEWQKLYIYSDWMYGFEVLPVFSPEDIFRYLRLPEADPRFKELRKGAAYRQAMNYVSAIATFKPVPNFGIRVYFWRELCSLFAPLAARYAEKLAKKVKGSERAREELQEHLEKKIEEIAADFDYFYASTNKLKGGNKKFAADNLFLPLRGRLAKLGHIFQAGEYPFTAYVDQKLKKEVREYLGQDIPMEETLFADLGSDSGENNLDSILSQDQDGALKIPDYDARDASGKTIGWKIKTFASITGKGISTLQRWDRKGVLKPLRYEIYSRSYKKNISYRAYTREHRSQIPKIEEDMTRRIIHA